MKEYQVHFSERGRSDFMDLRRSAACIIASWFSEYLDGRKNPRTRGRSLTGEVSRWRYRIGKYRVLAEIEEGSVVILAIIGSAVDSRPHRFP